MNTLLNIKSKGGSDELYTQSLAVETLLPFIHKEMKIVWEPTAVDNNAISKAFIQRGHTVEESHIDNGQDFFEYEPDNYDIQITNPPYSVKDKWIQRCFDLGKPFALLIPTTSLEGMKRGKMWKDNGVQLIIPNKRFYFRDPSKPLEEAKQTGGWYHTSWFTHGLQLANDLNFVEL